MATPIWKGYTVSRQTEDGSLSYIIKCDGVTIYTGKAYKRPGASDISFNIGDVCAPFLSSNAEIATAATGFMAINEMQRTTADGGINLVVFDADSNCETRRRELSDWERRSKVNFELFLEAVLNLSCDDLG